MFFILYKMCLLGSCFMIWFLNAFYFLFIRIKLIKFVFFRIQFFSFQNVEEWHCTESQLISTKKNVDELLKKLVFLPKTQTFLFLNLYNLNLIVQTFDISDVD